MTTKQLLLRNNLAEKLKEQAQKRDIPVDLLIEQWLDQDNASQRVAAFKQKFPTVEHLLQLLIDNVSDLICLHEPDGTYLYTSPSCEAVVGYHMEELVGTNSYDYFHPDDLAAIQASHNIALEGQPVQSVSYRMLCKSGFYKWLDTRTQPIINTMGDIEYLVTTSRDITQQHEIEEALRQERDLLQSIMDTSPAGITVVDKSGAIIFTNKRSEEIYGVKKEDITERTYDAPEWRHTDFDGNPLTDEKQPFVRVMKTREPVYDVRHAIEWTDGRRVLLSINGAPVFDEEGEISKVVFSLENVTELKRAEETLKNSLAKEKELNQLKSQFLSMVSHEFRTPLTVILTSTDLLRRQLADRLQPHEDARIERIREQVHHLAHLLDDVTNANASITTSHQLHREQVAIKSFLDQIITDIRLAYRDMPEISIHTYCEVEQVYLDAQLLHRIFSNLISNAVKYTKPGGHIVITIQCDPHSFKFSIQDDGIGIMEEDQERLFDFFYRGSNVGSVAGTGVGMAIVKQAVDLCGGTISFESAVGYGSTFVIAIPNPGE